MISLLVNGKSLFEFKIVTAKPVFFVNCNAHYNHNETSGKKMLKTHVNVQLESTEKNHQFMVNAEFTISHIIKFNLLRLRKTISSFFSSNNLSVLTLIDL